ncbi:MAG TPA: NAD(P)/FAD-dependent oxidoreductase [Xanthobacteraceae bacterium]|jgi:cation diffusion facilitator CzcD-associated flavoprotein CzcO
MSLAEFPAAVSVKRKFAASPVRTAKSRADCEVAVIGAGPYGLAVAAHLRAAGIDTHVFGEAMGFWQRNMPKGMKLRSPWGASHIADPAKEFSLDTYIRMNGVTRSEPFPLEEFVRYGQWFQRKAAPGLDERRVELVEGVPGGFALRLADGKRVTARRVVVALGLANQEFKPAEFAGLPADLVSHSSGHDNFERFRRQRVAVVGRGQSACESAVLLSEAGAEVVLISRGDVRWIGSENPGADEELVWSIHKVLTSTGAVGPFPLNWLVDAPALVRRLPAKLRDRLAERCLRPAATAWLRPRAAKIRINAGRTIAGARVEGSLVALRLDNGEQGLFDHVLCATGYKIDIAKLGILSPALLGGIKRSDGYPMLSAGFESTAPGLHFAGSSALRSFGPLMRFVWGAGYAARAVTRATLAARREARTLRA